MKKSGSATQIIRTQILKNILQDFPGDSVVKNPPANAGDMSSSPSLGRSHMLRSS